MRITIDPASYNEARAARMAVAAQQAKWSAPIFASKSITFPEAGTVVLSVVGAGGGGGASNSTSGAATGGNSAPWARKRIKVKAGDVLSLALGAGGAKAIAAQSSGFQGGKSTVKLNGATVLEVEGGEGGVGMGAGTANAPVPTAVATGADYWVPGVRAGSAQNNGTTSIASGGAAVDVLGAGLGRSPNAVSSNGVGGSVGTDAGGLPLLWLALSDFGMLVADGTTATASVGATGRGGVSSSIFAGHFAGGAAASTTQGQGGIGGGGGGGVSAANAGAGGPAYAYLTFIPEA